jgi:hypothetical protein
LAKSALVLLDADVVIEAFRLGIWELLTTKVNVYVASTVSREAGHYFDAVTGARCIIDLPAEAAAGRITIVEADSAQMGQVQNSCRPFLLDLHVGELESIALVRTAGHSFCTADHAAAKAMAVLDLSDRAASLESVLKRNGLAPKAEMKRYFSTATMNAWLKEGSVLRVQSFSSKRK